MQNNEQKMTEQQFLRILASSVCGIILCLVSLVGTTWAWYSMDIVCTNNVIEVGQFAAECSVISEDETSVVSLDGYYDLEAGTYTIRVEGASGNTSPGYCTVRADGEVVCQTVAIYPGEEGAEPGFLEFTLVLEEPAQLELIATIGKPTAEILLAHGETVTFPVSVQEEAESSEQPDPSEEEIP